MKPLKIFLLLLFVVTAVICTGDRYTHSRGVAFYAQDWDDDGDDDGGWEGADDDEGDMSNDDDEYDEYDDNEYDDGKYDKSWKKDDGDDDDDDWHGKKGGYHDKPYRHHHHHYHLIPRPRKPIIHITTRPPHHGNYNDGYNNGFNAGLLDPNNRNHTIEYIRTTTDCGIHKRIDVIDGVSYTFSDKTTVGYFGVTRTEVDLDSSTILLPYTDPEKIMATIPFGGVTRTIVQVKDEATTTLPLHIRPTPLPINNRMLEGLMPPAEDELGQVPDNVAMAVLLGDERRMALDAMDYGKSQALAVGDDGISGTVLRNIRFDPDGNPIIPSYAGTRPVYIINDRTTTLRNGIPPSFPADNGHTRTVIALRSGVLTLPLSGGDEITKILPLEGLTETVVVFDEMTYTLSPDNNTSSNHPPRPVPTKIVHTVVVEEILSSVPPSPPPPSPSSPPQPASVVATADAATISGIVGAGIVHQLISNGAMDSQPSVLYKIPPKTVVAPQPTEVSVISEASPLPALTPTSTTEPTLSFSSFFFSFSSIASSASAPEAETTNATATFAADTSIQSPLQSHCSTKWILDDALTSEGCYSLSSVVALDSEMRDVNSQGYWTADQCHSFCANSTQIHQLPSFASWFYGLTLSEEKNDNAMSSTCRCMGNLSGVQAVGMDDCRAVTLPPPLNNNTGHHDQPKPHRLGLVYREDDKATLSTIYIYHAAYRCLLPSLMKRASDTSSSIAPPEAWECPSNALEVNRRKSEGCYPYLAPKVTTQKARSSADGTDWYWTAARCYSYCLESGRVPRRGKWYYGITIADQGSASMENTCLCMLDMGSPPTATDCKSLDYHPPSTNTSSKEAQQDINTKIGLVNMTDLDRAAIYAYEVDYTCSPSCNATANNASMATFKISDSKATEGCYPLSNYADGTIKQVSKALTRRGDGAYTPEECFHICKDSSLIIPGQSWWYGISMTDPADVRKGSAGTSSCRCSIKAPSLSRHDFLAGRCNHNDMGLVDTRFLYRINNGVYVYKVSYQCPTDTQENR